MPRSAKKRDLSNNEGSLKKKTYSKRPKDGEKGGGGKEKKEQDLTRDNHTTSKHQPQCAVPTSSTPHEGKVDIHTTPNKPPGITPPPASNKGLFTNYVSQK